jgi:hypothetical protein
MLITSAFYFWLGGVILNLTGSAPANACAKKHTSGSEYFVVLAKYKTSEKSSNNDNLDSQKRVRRLLGSPPFLQLKNTTA